MRYIIYQIFLYTIFCVCMCSCDPTTSYNYIINNRSCQNLSIIFYPEENPLTPSPDVKEYTYGTLNGHLYWISYVGNESDLIDYPIKSLNLNAGESLKFLELSYYHLFISKNPEKGGSAPLWMQNNCIEKIIIVSDDKTTEREISVDYWSNPRNWIIQNKKYDSIEYWLVIDDGVIREHSIDNH